MPFAQLNDRTTLTVIGEPSEHFLQTLITTDLSRTDLATAQPSALLTPQGKVLFDFLIGRIEGGFRLDVASSVAADLKRRLLLYKLRTKIDVGSEDAPVFAIWDEDRIDGAYCDRRFGDARVWRSYGAVPADIPEAPAEVFRMLRIRNAVAEAETDYPGSDVFPHDVLHDQNGGVSFQKGCFVGQEVVSRMQHRGTARRRLMLVNGEDHLTPGSAIMAGGRQLGTILACAGHEAMAFVRIDRLADALSGPEIISADGVPLVLSIPPWAGFALPEAQIADTAS